MGKRLISGTCFILILVGFFFLRQDVCIHAFSALIWFFCIAGTFEMARAFKKYSNTAIRILQIAFGFVVFPLFYGLTYIFNFYESLLLTVAFAIVIEVIIAFISEISLNKSDEKTTTYNLVPAIYPSALLFVMLTADMMYKNKTGFIILLLAFAIPCACDTFAYLVGMAYQKIKHGTAKKLCPVISPNKTVAGAIGGIIGGVIGSVIVYLCIMSSFKTENLLFFIGMGILAGIATEIGDIFESLIKRKVGIKDMGNIMPGHGGVMDRIDGISFASVVIFTLIYAYIHLR